MLRTIEQKVKKVVLNVLMVEAKTLKAKGKGKPKAKPKVQKHLTIAPQATKGVEKGR